MSADLVLVAAENQDCENDAAGTATEVDGLNQALLAKTRIPAIHIFVGFNH
jgi:hypothetical protein